MYDEVSDVAFSERATTPERESLLTFDAFYPTPGTLVNPNGYLPASTSLPDESGQCHWAAIDLSRTQARGDDSAITLSINAVRSTSDNTDFIVWVERESQCKISKARSNVTVQVG